MTIFSGSLRLSQTGFQSEEKARQTSRRFVVKPQDEQAIKFVIRF